MVSTMMTLEVMMTLEDLMALEDMMTLEMMTLEDMMTLENLMTLKDMMILKDMMTLKDLMTLVVKKILMSLVLVALIRNLLKQKIFVLKMTVTFVTVKNGAIIAPSKVASSDEEPLKLHKFSNYDNFKIRNFNN
jgi:hypothetical protein